MRRYFLWLAGLALVSGTAFAEPPRMSLSITQPIGAAAGDLCVKDTIREPLPVGGLMLTERDVASWEPATGIWVLDPARLSGFDNGWRLVDHCYELAIDGKVISKGMVLWMHSARLIRFPVLLVASQKKSLSLQLRSGHGHGTHLIHGDKLNEVFRHKPRMASPDPTR